MNGSSISDHDFAKCQALIHGGTSIHHAPITKALLCGGLSQCPRSRNLTATHSIAIP